MHEVHFSCRVAETSGELDRAWQDTVGSGHAALALRADWQAHLARCRRELGFRYVRFHALLGASMDTLVCEERRMIYSFHNADLVFDFLRSIGMKPFVELSFMPEALASGHTTVFHYEANVTRPRDYDAWAELIRRLILHWIDRYGLREVRTWRFEVWNEPNLRAFWPGTQAEYFHLYRSTAAAIKRVDPSLQVGGPATAKNEWIEEFLRYADTHRVPVDFVSTHHYPTDALGTAATDTEAELAASSRSMLREWAQNTRRRVGDRPLYYTEWNVSSDPHDHLHDEPYAAAVIVKTMLEANGLTQGYSFWTFSDIFAENYFPSCPFHGGFGLLTLHGIAKPSYRAFQFLAELPARRVLVDGLHATMDCWVAAAPDRVCIVLTNHALPRHLIYPQRVVVTLEGMRPPRAATVERIDDRHANAKEAWRNMGEPEYLTASQVARLDRASMPHPQPIAWRHDAGTTRIRLGVPAHGVALVTLRTSSAA